jgi:hypothetical protein
MLFPPSQSACWRITSPGKEARVSKAASKADLRKRISIHPKDTGIPEDELEAMCLRHGLDALDGPGLAIRKTANGPKGERPITLTIEGELARSIREFAKITGIRPSSQARQLVGFGLMNVDESQEARDYRRDMAIHWSRRSMQEK